MLTTITKMLKTFKLNKDDFATKEAKEYVDIWNKKTFDEKIETVFSILLLQEEQFIKYIDTLKDFHMVGFGSFREMKDRRYCLQRTKEIKAQFPDITGSEIFKMLKDEIAERRILRKNLRKRR